MTDDIRFRGQKQHFYEFHNFYKSKIIIDGVKYISAEQYYQAEKFNYPNYCNITGKIFIYLNESIIDPPSQSSDSF